MGCTSGDESPNPNGGITPALAIAAWPADSGEPVLETDTLAAHGLAEVLALMREQWDAKIVAECGERLGQFPYQLHDVCSSCSSANCSAMSLVGFGNRCNPTRRRCRSSRSRACNHTTKARLCFPAAESGPPS